MSTRTHHGHAVVLYANTKTGNSRIRICCLRREQAAENRRPVIRFRIRPEIKGVFEKFVFTSLSEICSPLLLTRYHRSSYSFNAGAYAASCISWKVLLTPRNVSLQRVPLTRKNGSQGSSSFIKSTTTPRRSADSSLPSTRSILPNGHLLQQRRRLKLRKAMCQLRLLKHGRLKNSYVILT